MGEVGGGRGWGSSEEWEWGKRSAARPTQPPANTHTHSRCARLASTVATSTTIRDSTWRKVVKTGLGTRPTAACTTSRHMAHCTAARGVATAAHRVARTAAGEGVGVEEAEAAAARPASSSTYAHPAMQARL